MVNKGRAARVKRDPEKDYYADLRKVRLGSRPFMAGVMYFIVRKEPYFVPTTLDEQSKKLYYFADIFLDLKSEGKVKTTDPRHIGKREIDAFVVWMRSRDLKPASREKYLRVLNGYLLFWGNHELDDMWGRHELGALFKGAEEDIKYIEQEDLQKIFDTIRIWEGYEGILLRGYISLIFGVAGRPKEIIDALIGDINTKDWIYYVRHPKGEGSWGKKEWLPIVRADMHPFITQFLVERKAYLLACGIRSKFLFVNPTTGNPYTLKRMREIKHKVEIVSGVDFQLKEFRATYATITFANAPELGSAISKQMRHGNEATTRKYYIAYLHRQAAKHLQNEWKKSRIN